MTLNKVRVTCPNECQSVKPDSPYTLPSWSNTGMLPTKLRNADLAASRFEPVLSKITEPKPVTLLYDGSNSALPPSRLRRLTGAAQELHTTPDGPNLKRVEARGKAEV
jgi:hypothetical protein